MRSKNNNVYPRIIISAKPFSLLFSVFFAKKMHSAEAACHSEILDSTLRRGIEYLDERRVFRVSGPLSERTKRK